ICLKNPVEATGFASDRSIRVQGVDGEPRQHLRVEVRRLLGHHLARFGDLANLGHRRRVHHEKDLPFPRFELGEPCLGSCKYVRLVFLTWASSEMPKRCSRMPLWRTATSVVRTTRGREPSVGCFSRSSPGRSERSAIFGCREPPFLPLPAPFAAT